MIASAIEESERETVIQISEGIASIFTASLSVYRKLKKLGYRITQDTDHYAWFEAPAKVISFRRSAVSARQLTPEQKQAAANRLKQARLTRSATKT